MEVVRFKDEKTGKFGLKYENGQIIIPGEYDFVEYIDRFPGHQTIILVEKNRKWGVLDENGNVIIDIKHDFIKPIFEPKSVPLRQIKYAVRKDDKYGFIETNSDEPKYIYDDVNTEASLSADDASYSYGSFAVEKDGKWGAVNSIDLEPIVKCKYESVVINGFNTIVIGNNHGKKIAVNRSCKRVVKSKYDSIYGEDEKGFRIVENNKKQGIIDADGKEFIKCKYDHIYDEDDDGFRIVENDKKQGFIDVEGKEILECKYDQIISSQLPGLMEVRKGDDAIYVDTNGKRLTKDVYAYKDEDRRDKQIIFLTSFLQDYSFSDTESIEVFRDLEAKFINDYLDDVLSCKLAQFKFEFSKVKDTLKVVEVHAKYEKQLDEIFKMCFLGVEIEAKEAKIDVEQRKAKLNEKKDRRVDIF